MERIEDVVLGQAKRGAAMFSSKAAENDGRSAD